MNETKWIQVGILLIGKKPIEQHIQVARKPEMIEKLKFRMNQIQI